MIREEIRSIKTGIREWRSYGLTVGIILCLIGGLLLWRDKNYWSYFLVPGLGLAVCGLFLPQLLKPMHKAWMVFSIVLGWFMTRLVLSVVFYLVVTPIGLIPRLFGKSFLPLGADTSQKSYWIPREKKPFDKDRCERQF